jgi:hypothetical protein
MSALQAHGAWIAGEVLATALDAGHPGPGASEITIDDQPVRVELRRGGERD